MDVVFAGHPVHGFSCYSNSTFHTFHINLIFATLGKPLGNRLVFWNDLNLKILFVHFVVNAGYSNLNICMIIAVTGTVGAKRFKIICAKFY